MKFVEGPAFAQRALTSCVETVHVTSSDKF